MKTDSRFNAKKLRLEPLENREMLSAEPIASAAVLETAQFAQLDEANAVAAAVPIDLSAVFDASGAPGASDDADPQLAIVASGVVVPTRVAVGGEATFACAAFQNKSGAAISGYSVSVYASTDAAISSDDVLLTTFAELKTIDADATAILPSATLVFDSLDPGTYYIGWTVSIVDVAASGSASALCSGTVTVDAPAPKLEIVSSGNPSSTTVYASSGDVALVDAIVSNAGEGVATGYKVDVYASTDAALSDDDVLLTTYVDETTVVESGATAALPAIPFDASGLDAGTYRLIWTISTGEGTSASTAKAVCGASSTVDANPRLEVVASGEAFPSTTTTVGKPTFVSAAFQNKSGAAISGYSVAVYASTDATISTDDVLLGTLDATTTVDAGATEVLAPIPLDLAALEPGTYYVGWTVSAPDVASATALCAGTALVEPAALSAAHTNTTRPTVGAEITAVVYVDGEESEEASATATYRWFRVDADGVETEIAGATTRTYTPTDDDLDYRLRVVAVATGRYTGTVSATHMRATRARAALSEIHTSASYPTVGVEITARLYVDGKLETSATATYRWFRVDADGAETEIDGATARTYTPTDDDLGYRLRVVATGTGGYTGTVSATHKRETAASLDASAVLDAVLESFDDEEFFDVEE